MNETFLKFIEDLEISPYCLASFNHLFLELKERRLWPLKFIDSMEFLPSGLLEGVMSMFGVYEECINIESPMVKWNDIRGKYCLAKIRLPFLSPLFPTLNDEFSQNYQLRSIDDLFTYNGRKSLYARINRDFDYSNNKFKLLQMLNMFNGSNLRIGLCFPSTCSSFELERAINKFLQPINNPIRIEIEEECSYKSQEIELNNHQRFSIFILVSLCLLVGACTGFEYYIHNFRDQNEIKKNQYNSYLLTFSALSNTRYLLGYSDMAADDDEKRLCSIDTITLFFVIMEFIGRSYVLPIFYGLINIKRALNGLTDQYFTAKKFFFIRGSSFAVSTYVLASAIILAFNICGQKSQIKPSFINYVKFVLNRYLSIIRKLIGPILLIYLMPLLGDGPIWHYFTPLYVEPCQNNLWKTLLLINNYESSFEKVCLSPSIIFSAIFYMSLTAPFILYTLNHKYFGYIVFITLIILGTIISILPKIVYNLPVTPYEISTITSVSEAKLSFIHYYAATDQLIVVFVIGLFIGYLIRCKPKIDLGKRAANIALWIGMLALPVISSQWNDSFKPLKGNFSQFSFISWFLLSKIMWCFGFGWIIYSCSTGRAKAFNQAITISLIRPIGKLAFGAYLNHITILSFRQLTKKQTSPLTNVEILTNDISDIVIAFTVAYIFYILIERPFYYWIKIIINIEKDLDVNNEQQTAVKRFSMTDLENGKLHGDHGEFDLKPLNDRNYSSRL
ncbi:nose resistant to fluoxetine protein 6-like [Dermatophagoides pteronyssinus]|uniref:nose resistant to fluoxetine protein 6-like n=1 Tax=Dermatophagoides pteronyssinus TaxID=6956 RepID=UPI003F66B293